MERINETSATFSSHSLPRLNCLLVKELHSQPNSVVWGPSKAKDRTLSPPRSPDFLPCSLLAFLWKEKSSTFLSLFHTVKSSCTYLISINHRMTPFSISFGQGANSMTRSSCISSSFSWLAQQRTKAITESLLWSSLVRVANLNGHMSTRSYSQCLRVPRPVLSVSLHYQFCQGWELSLSSLECEVAPRACVPRPAPGFLESRQALFSLSRRRCALEI